MFKKIRVFHLLNIIIAIIFIFSMIAIVNLVSHFQHQEALKAAEQLAGTLLDERLSIHRYINSDLKPGIFEHLDESELEEGYFDPIWMSSTFAIRNIHRYFSSTNHENYYYKEAAINARSPSNEADEYEREFLLALNAGSAEIKKAEIRIFDGQPYFQTIRMGETMEQECLYCHSTPQEAPSGLVKIYGGERSFNRTAGEIVSAISIRIPLSEAYVRANSTSFGLSVILALMLSGIFIMQYWLSRKLIYSPITRLSHLAQEISADPQRLGEHIDARSGVEFRQLSDSFNTMSTKLKQNIDGLEETIEARTKELSITVKELETFAYTVSHDIKNPILRIRNYVHLLKEDQEEEPESETFIILKRIDNDSRRAMDLVNSILQLSRISRSELFLMEIDLSRIVRDVLAGLKSSEPDRDIHIEIEPDITALADKNLMTVLFENLIGNAWKFTAKNEHSSIEFGHETIDGENVYFVKDNGVGFDLEDSEMLFEPFQRFHSDPDFKGSGIGLATVSRIAALHKGKIWAESIPGQGSTFYFTLKTSDETATES